MEKDALSEDFIPLLAVLRLVLSPPDIAECCLQMQVAGVVPDGIDIHTRLWSGTLRGFIEQMVPPMR